MLLNGKRSIGVLVAVIAGLAIWLTGCGGATTATPPLELSATRPSLLFFYTPG